MRAKFENYQSIVFEVGGKTIELPVKGARYNDESMVFTGKDGILSIKDGGNRLYVTLTKNPA